MVQHFSDITDIRLVELLMDGAVGVIPTDTVYGLVARACDPVAVAKHYAIKQRELAPGTMIGPSGESFAALGLPMEQIERVARYWPAPLSVVLDARDAPSYLKQKRTALPVRIPASAGLMRLLERTGPLMTTSANRPGEPTSTTVDEAIAYFGDTVDFYVDGGNLGVRSPSTIVGFDDNGEIIVFRTGAFPTDQLT